MTTANMPDAIPDLEDVPPLEDFEPTHEFQHNQINAEMVAISRHVGTVDTATVIQRFASAAARDAAITAPTEPMMVWVGEQLQAYIDGVWQAAWQYGVDVWTASKYRRVSDATGFAIEWFDGTTWRPVWSHEVAATGAAQSPNIVLGHYGNAASPGSYGNTISGGGSIYQENIIGGDTSTVGDNNTHNTATAGVNSDLCIIGGGYDNMIKNGVANIVTGYHNQANDTTHATIAGGSFNNAFDGNYPTISGGTLNEVGNDFAVVTGGVRNKAHGSSSAVGGGKDNLALAAGSVVVGGEANTVAAVANYGTIVGGKGNSVPNPRGTVIGGENCVCEGTYGTATGKDALSRNAGQVAHSGGSIAQRGDAQVSRMVLRRQTVGTASALLSLSSSTVDNSPQLQPDSSNICTWRVVARHTASSDTAAWTITAVVENPAGASAQILGTPTVTVLYQSAVATAWTVNVLAGTDSVAVQVTGSGGPEPVYWVSSLEVVEVVA